MSTLKSSVASEPCPYRFLEQNPALSNTLIAECNNDINAVTTLIKPVLQVQKRCQITSFYIQGVIAGRTTFLTTNLSRMKSVQNTAIASSWTVGRSLTCAIAIQDSSVSRCHAVINHHCQDGFNITDIGSTNGTWVNCRRLKPMERRTLQDGDVIQIGNLKFEFFIANQSQLASHSNLAPNESTLH